MEEDQEDEFTVNHVQQDSLLFERLKNVILAESPTLRLFKAIERDNFEGVKQALASGAIVCPHWDENALTSRVNKLISMYGSIINYIIKFILL